MQWRLTFCVWAASCSGVMAAPSAELAEQAILIPPAEQSTEDAAIGRWQQEFERGHSARALERLGWAYVAKARTTLDEGNYALALLTADALARREGPTTAERLLRGHILINLHRFHEAEAAARELLALESGPLGYALLSDALCEQGRIDEAVAACARLGALQPGFECSVRSAHLRWLTGDVPGAAAAMTDAIRASSPLNREPRAWALAQLSGYELQRGRPASALAIAESAARAFPGLPAALLAEGQALLALDRARDAVPPLQAVADRTSQVLHRWWLAEAQRAAGDAAAAARTETMLRESGRRGDPRTWALFLATCGGGDPAEAVRLARRELETRRDPLTWDALAWSLLASGDVPGADEAMRHALAAGTYDPRIELHAAAIARAAGRAVEARTHLERAAAGRSALLPAECARLEHERAAAPRISSS